MRGICTKKIGAISQLGAEKIAFPLKTDRQTYRRTDICFYSKATKNKDDSINDNSIDVSLIENTDSLFTCLCVCMNWSVHKPYEYIDLSKEQTNKPYLYNSFVTKKNTSHEVKVPLNIFVLSLKLISANLTNPYLFSIFSFLAPAEGSIPVGLYTYEVLSLRVSTNQIQSKLSIKNTVL